MGGGEYACFGRRGCQLAWIHLLNNPDDVRGAKELAANYCLDNFAECSNGAAWEELGNEFLAQAAGGAIGAGIVASRIRAGAASRGSCANSFSGDTLVLMADGSTKRIDEIEVGDEVAASEPESAVVEGHVVTAVHVTDEDKDYVDLTVSTPDGAKVVRTTAHHPFYNASTREWADAELLHAGEELSTPGNGRVEVSRVRPYFAALRTYNLSVETIHTYYVVAGNTPVLVHNTGGCFKFEPSPKHGNTQRGNAAPQPTNPQGSLDSSVSIGPNTTRRAGADKVNGEFSIFDETYPESGIFHGHVRSWGELSQQQQSALIKGGLANRRGKIL
jgi:hypothetical protein